MNIDSLGVFEKAFLSALLWSEDDPNRNYEPFDSHYTIHDFSEDALIKISMECHRFKLVAYEYTTWSLYNNKIAERAGRDFALTRNGHGTGFWDRPDIYGKEDAKILTVMSDCFGEIYVYVNDETGKLEVA